MKVTLSAIADYASVSEGAKLNVLGIFDSIGSRQFPARLSGMVFAFRVLAEWEDGGKEHVLFVTLEDEDGQRALEMEGRVSIEHIDPGMFEHYNQILHFRDLVFQRPGQYVVRLQVDGTTAMEHRFQVVQLDDA